MLFLQDVAYAHPNRDMLLKQINISINKNEKVSLIGHNGTGKSTLLKLMAGVLQPTSGLIKSESIPYYIPQLVGQANDLTIAQALYIDQKINALRKILNGEVTDEHLVSVGDDWSVEERCAEAFANWELDLPDLSQRMQTLSGGQKTKVFLAGIDIHSPDIVLMDEPSNHLDLAARKKLYQYVQHTPQTLVIVSHDRQLLNIPETVYALSRQGISLYGGNYDFYLEQKRIENEALSQDIRNKERALRKAKEIERESVERQQKLDARGKKKQEKAGLPTISMNTFRNNAEKSTSRIKNVHAEKTGAIAQEVHHLRRELPEVGKMKMDFDHSGLHKGKILMKAEQVNFAYDGQQLWKLPLDFQIVSGERIAIKGRNGSGKTTLIRMVLNTLQPSAGLLEIMDFNAIYIDQEYSLIDPALTVYEQVQRFNSGALQEHEIKIRLNRYLFGQESWVKPCSALSGGEKMRLILCSLAVSNHAPDMIVLDEPTNNLDIQNIEILSAAVNEYEGTLLVISHDEYFLKEINVARAIDLDLANISPA
ncbi:ABC-F family ATP-binding cassette domain-containing protein [Dyadobacter aurulentus]|uniref:ABC-F family ATP-binding cassette domain-containing protein n=1 Tax=Dyadobacter sp. UC 10 TaxID=2605428 RepID=UPI0011F3A697|nr:ABC-F family ATP-binding cassette domain-containing protein [Dyadobacter sp. UC 10]KAA0993295.1 ABC-F family ATP-binding cassette domain-containing protein [Dyadobacter sp. UC 10]